MTAIALTIAGSDSGAGAGVQADLKTFSALGVYCARVITALTAQNTIGVHDVPAAFIRQKMGSVLGDLDVKPLKIGMLSRQMTIRAVVAASGDLLLRASAINALKTILMPRASVITPNLHEAAALTDRPVAGNEREMEQQARMLHAAGARAVLIKGGHRAGTESVDILISAYGMQRYTALRIDTHNVQGTGCTLSSAIVAGLARDCRWTLPVGLRRFTSLKQLPLQHASRLVTVTDPRIIFTNGGEWQAFHIRGQTRIKERCRWRSAN